MKKYLFLLAGLALITGLILSAPVVAFTACIGFMFLFSNLKETRAAYTGLNLTPSYLYRAVGLEEQPPITRAQKYLFDYIRSKGNIVTLQALDVNALKFEAITYYQRFSITGLSGKQKFLGQNTINSVGISNFPLSAVMQQYYNFAFDRIGVSYVVDNATGFANVYNSNGFTAVRGSVAAGLGNAELSLIVNNNLVLPGTPVADFLGEAAVTGGAIGNYSGGDLQEPIVFPELAQLEGYVDMPVVIPSVANTNYVLEVRFYGCRARIRG